MTLSIVVELLFVWVVLSSTSDINMINTLTFEFDQLFISAAVKTL